MCDCICGEADDLDDGEPLSDDELLAFERRMIAGGEKTYLDCLIETGMRIPPPEELDDGTLHAKLWEVIRGLALLRVFVESTDHLADRTLYERLYRGVLREIEWVVHIGTYDLRIDMTDGFGSSDPVEMWLRYYADEESRRGLLEEEPDYPMPPRRSRSSIATGICPSRSSRRGSMRSPNGPQTTQSPRPPPSPGR